MLISRKNENTFQDPLFSATKDGRIYDVIQIVEKSNTESQLQKKNFFKQSVLHLAVNYDHLILVKYFIRVGCNINSRDYINQTALHRACIRANKNKNSKILKYLLNQYSIEINIRDIYGNLPIHYLTENLDLFLYYFNLKQSFTTLNSINKCKQPLLFSLKMPNKTFCEKFKYLLQHELNINFFDENFDTFILPACSCVSIKSCPLFQYFSKLKFLNFILRPNVYDNRPEWKFLIKEPNVSFQNELNEMKKWVINFQTGETLYDILTFKRSKVIRYSKNCTVNEIFNFCNQDFQNCFPHFGSLLTKRFKKLLIRRQLIDELVLFLKKCSLMPISEDVLYNVMKYLTDQELFELNVLD